MKLTASIAFAAALAALSLSSSVLFSSPASAQGYPTKTVRVVVPYSTGTPPDIVTRLVADRMTAGLGQPVLVDNRPGAIGTVGLAELGR